MTKYLNIKLISDGKFSVLIGTGLYIFASRERHSKLKNRYVHLFRTKGRYSGRRVVFVCLLVGCLSSLQQTSCLTSLQQTSVSQGRICSDNCTCCHTEVEAADQTFYLTQSQYTDTGLTSPSSDPLTQGAWQGSHWSANF